MSGKQLDIDVNVPEAYVAYTGTFTVPPTVSIVKKTTLTQTKTIVVFGPLKPIPANGKIVLTLPSANPFDASTPPPKVLSSTNIDGGLGIPTVDTTANPPTITFARDGKGADIPTNADVKIVFEGLTNSPAPGETGVFGIETVDSLGGSLDKDAAVPGVAITCKG